MQADVKDLGCHHSLKKGNYLAILCLQNASTVFKLVDLGDGTVHHTTVILKLDFAMERAFDFLIWNDPSLLIVLGLQKNSQGKFSLVYVVATFRSTDGRISLERIYGFKPPADIVAAGLTHFSYDLPQRILGFFDPMLGSNPRQSYHICIFLEFKPTGEEQQVLTMPVILNIKLDKITRKLSEPLVDLKPLISEYTRDDFFTVIEPEFKKYGGRRIFTAQQQNEMAVSVLQDSDGLKLVYVVDSQTKVYFGNLQYPSKS